MNTTSDSPIAYVSVDEQLRSQGFRILARARGKEPIWERRGKPYAQSRALDIIAATLPKEKK